MKKVVSVNFDIELLRKLDDWIAAQQPVPKRTAVIEAAIRNWLKARSKK